MVPKIVELWMADENCKNLMQQLAELLHVLMYLHAGFPELYDPVLECIKVICIHIVNIPPPVDNFLIGCFRRNIKVVFYWPCHGWAKTLT